VLSLDLTRTVAPAVSAAHGITFEELDGCAGTADRFLEEVRRERKAGKHAFLDLPYDEAAAGEVEAYVRSVRGRFRDLLLLGIGGSALGARLLQEALAGTGEEGRLRVLDNIDPDWVEETLDGLDPESTLVNVVSKSGTTVETAAQYLRVKEWLGRQAQDPAHWVFTTDPAQGLLRRTAREEGIRAFSVPPAVGGRYSVLGAVGLLPAAWLGISVGELLEGARGMVDRCLAGSVRENPAAAWAAVQYLLHRRKGKTMAVVMPYSWRLRSFPEWYAQLLAESLGKKHDLTGAVVHTGITPVRALGVTDQHSQLQLYTEGPNDKWILFVEVEGSNRAAHALSHGGSPPELSFLAGKSLADLMRAEKQGTEQGLVWADRPNATLRLDRLTPRSVGGLIVLCEVAVALLGKFLQVDPYDQPGVEAGKRAALALLGHQRYREERSRLDRERPSFSWVVPCF
jgi:glucose-6-phosphate isomerase